jgi:sensor histidine kinase YesM
MKYWSLFLLFLYTLTKVHASEQDTIYLRDNVNHIINDIEEQCFFSRYNQPIQKIILEKFQRKRELNFSYVTGWLWIKLVIKNKGEDSRFVLHASDGHISGLYLYKPILGGYKMTVPKLHHPEDGREISNRLPAFYIDLKKGETKTFYLKINSENEIINLDFFLKDYTGFVQFIAIDQTFIGLYLGALLLIIIINIFYFYSLKDSIFLIYAAYVFGNFIFTVTLDGFIWLLAPNSDIAYHLNFFCIRFWNDSMLFFVMHLVNIGVYNKRLSNIGYAFIIYHSFIVAIFDLFNFFNVKEHFMAQWEGINWAICVTLVLIVILKSQKNNKYLINYYIILCVILLLMLTCFLLGHTERGKNYLIFEYGIKVGTLLEIITLSFAVSRRFKFTEADLKDKKEEQRQSNEKVKQLEMDVRKAQMNPHFMFNALTSIEYFITKNNTEKARLYLDDFANLMRLTLDNSRSNYIPLDDELRALKLYIGLEFLRLEANKHIFEIQLNELDPNTVLVPALLIQPFVENAIWHGLQKKENSGKLLIVLTYHENELQCTIEDDGGGIDKRKVASNRKSSGILITKERLTLIHALLKTTYKFNIEDIKNERGDSVGTRVQFNMPYVIEF